MPIGVFVASWFAGALSGFGWYLLAAALSCIVPSRVVSDLLRQMPLRCPLGLFVHLCCFLACSFRHRIVHLWWVILVYSHIGLSLSGGVIFLLFPWRWAWAIFCIQFASGIWACSFGIRGCPFLFVYVYYCSFFPLGWRCVSFLHFLYYCCHGCTIQSFSALYASPGIPSVPFDLRFFTWHIALSISCRVYFLVNISCSVGWFFIAWRRREFVLMYCRPVCTFIDWLSSRVVCFRPCLSVVVAFVLSIGDFCFYVAPPFFWNVQYSRYRLFWWCVEVFLTHSVHFCINSFAFCVSCPSSFLIGVSFCLRDA